MCQWRQTSFRVFPSHFSLTIFKLGTLNWVCRQQHNDDDDDDDDLKWSRPIKSYHFNSILFNPIGYNTQLIVAVNIKWRNTWDWPTKFQFELAQTAFSGTKVTNSTDQFCPSLYCIIAKCPLLWSLNNIDHLTNQSSSFSYFDRIEIHRPKNRYILLSSLLAR